MMQYFKPRWLMFWWATGCFWFASWLFPTTRAIWDQLDNWIFYNFNGSLASGKAWQAFWAITNWRPFDVIAALLILLISLIWVYRSETNERLDKLGGLVTLLIIIILTRLSAALLLQLTEYQRYSPSIMLEPSYRLNAMVEWIETKDYHKDCFPGDHGYVIISTIIFFFIQAGRRWGITTLLLFTPFIIPRLVGGAHWATDILIGSGSMALLSMPLLFATPAYHLGQKFIGGLIRRLLKPLLPLLRLD